MGWNNQVVGQLATGDNKGSLVMWDPISSGWNLKNFCKLMNSIEDISWHPADENILAVAACDGFIHLFDTRMKSNTSVTILVCGGAIKDVNAVAFNPNQPYMISTGDETGACKIYDTRYTESHVAKLCWHHEAITSVSWHPTDSSIFAASSRDDSISIWDLSIENECFLSNETNIPQQLMFEHMGQTDITQVAFHPQIPGVLISTAVDGFNIFKCSNID